MSQIIIGKAGDMKVALDLDVLLRTRLLVQANSGGGKSWLLRRLAEQLFGKVQVIIIDREGEFASLREKFDYILAGQGGETPADVRSAKLLAQRLLELRVSAICDLYEAFRSKPGERRAWVRAFLESLVDAPKKYWRPLVVIVDEAHQFCPQETPKAASMIEREVISGCKDAMIALATVGRKRGFCAVWATQRLAKLDKDASAELFNRLVGMTIEDVDVDRAADLMSVSKDEKADFKKSLKTLEPGDFYAFGRAITKDRLLLKVGAIATAHPELGVAGKHAAEPPPPSEKIKALLPKLKDLPQAAEEKARTEAEFRAEIRSLKAQIRESSKRIHPEQAKRVEGSAVRKVFERVSDPAALRKLDAQRRGEIQQRDQIVRHLTSHLTTLSSLLAGHAKKAAAAACVKLPESKAVQIDLRRAGVVAPENRPAALAGQGRGVERRATSPQRGGSIPPTRSTPPSSGDLHLKAGARRMLVTLAQWHPDPLSRDQLGALAGFAASGGTFTDYLSKLRQAGYISENGYHIELTDDGLRAAGAVPPRPDDPRELLSLWKSKFKAGVGRILDVLFEGGDTYLSREELGERSGFTASGGTFTDYLSQIRRSRLIEERGHQLRLAEVFRT